MARVWAVFGRALLAVGVPQLPVYEGFDVCFFAILSSEWLPDLEIFVQSEMGFVRLGAPKIDDVLMWNNRLEGNCLEWALRL